MDPAHELSTSTFTSLSIHHPVPSCAAVYEVRLDRPAQRNALSLSFFKELPRAISLLDSLPSARAIVLSAAGPHFCSGIDVSALSGVIQSESDTDDVARKSESLRRNILAMQDAISAVEKCRKPVIVAIQGACVGGGVDLVTACDLRLCDQNAYFQVKEVDLGLAADLGTLQRLPHIVGFGNAMDLALTARKLSATEAKQIGLVSRIFASREELQKGAFQIAKDLAEKSAIAVMGTKAVMLKSRDMKINEGLEHVATWNSAMLMCDDLKEAVMASIEKRKPVFSKL